MSIPPRGGKGKSALEIPRSLAELGVPVWRAKLNSEGGPVRRGWQNLTADGSDEEIESWRPGMAMCASTGYVFDVIDHDPRNDSGGRNLRRLLADLGDLEYSFKIRTPSGGTHYYIASLGLGRSYHPMPGYAGVDIQAEGALVFLPPTVRKGGNYEV
jgi:hypothetical protein